MTGLKDRQRLALYVALGLSAGSGLTLDASTAYADPLDISADNTQYANGVDMGATNGNKLTIGATGGDPADTATPMEHPVIGKDVVGGIANDAYGNDIIIESIKAVDADYGRVYGAHAAGTVEGNSIKFNGGVVNALIGAESTSTGTAGTHGAQRNTVTVTGGKVHGNVTGGIGGTYSSVNHNIVSISGSRIEGQVNGGAGGDNAVVTGNEVRISGGSLTTVNGGIGKNGSTVNDNTVTVTGGTFGTGSRIVGGETGATSTKSNANKIILGSEEGVYTADLAHTEIWGSRYDTAGVIAGSDVDERIKGNTLTVNAQNVTVDKVRNFEKYKFNLNKSVARDASMLTVVDADGFGTGANVAWSNIEFSAENWTGVKNGDGSHTHYGKSGVQTLIQTSDGSQHLVIHNETELIRKGLSGDFEYKLATDNPADPTATNGAVSVAKVTAEVNRIQNANAVYDATGRPADADNAVRGGYSAYGNTVKDNSLRVTNLLTGGLDAAYGGEVAGLAGDVLKNTLTITSTLDHTPAPGTHQETLTNAYGGAITNVGNNGTVGGLGENEGNRIMASGKTTITNLYAGYTAGTGNVQGNLAAIGNGTVISKSYGGYSAHAAGTGTVEKNGVLVGGGTLTNVYGGASVGSGAITKNYAILNGGTVTDVYGGFASGSATVTGNRTVVQGVVTPAGVPLTNVTGTIYGAKATSGVTSGNQVFVRRGTAANHVVGAETTTGNVSGSHVFIAGGTIGSTAPAVLGSVMGAQSADGNVDGNSVTITGGTIVGTVHGGAATGSGNVTNNAVNLGNEDNHNLRNANLAAADLIGSTKGTGTASGNALNVYAKNANVHTVSAFDTHHFILDRAITDGATMLSITEGGFSREIDWNSVVVENEPTMMKDGNPGGRVILAKDASSDKLKIAGYAKRDMSVGNIEHVVELENPTETSTGHFEAERLLLTYAKFKDNTWTYDGADSSPTSESNEVFGGISYMGHTTDNNVLTVTAVPDGGLAAAYGGKTAAGAANSTNNHVNVIGTHPQTAVMTGGIKKVYGGYTVSDYAEDTNGNAIAGVAAENEAVVYDGTVSEGLYGGYAKGNKGKARSNKAIVGGGSVANVYGGLATENGGEATENKAEIYGGTVTNVYGGAVDKVDAAATKNKVQVRGGRVTGEIAGARVIYDTTLTATHTLSNGNNVMLGSEEPTRALDMNVAGTSIYGTDYRDVTSGVAGTPELTFDSASDQIKDNELIVTTTGVSAKKVRNFDSYTFVLGDNFENKDTMLTLTEAGGFGTVSNAASHPAVKVDWGKIKANTSKLTDRRGGGIHGRNNFTLMQEAVPGATNPNPSDFAFSNYTDTAGIAEIDRVYEKKMTADVAPAAAGATDTSANKVLLELNRFRNDEVTHKGTEAQTPAEVYGGYSGYDHTEKVSGVLTTLGTTTESNILNIEGIANGTTLKAYGGYTGGAHGGSKDNTVHINLEELPGNVASGDLDSVYGGYAEGANAGAVSGNIVTFSQGATLHDLMGGYLKSTTSTSDVSGNQVFIAGGEFNNAVATDPAPRIYGGATDGSGTATKNVLQITGGTIGNATHAADVIGGRSATGAAVENHVFLGSAEPGATPTAPTLKGNVTGGYGATATDNTVEILAGTLDGSVYGGYATTAGTPATTGVPPTAEVSALRNNKVTLRDGVTVTGNVYGAYAAADASSMTAATDSNTINLYKAVIDGTIYGGMAKDNTTGNDVVSGKNNTLAVHARGAKADDFVGVQNLHFYVPAGTTAADKETMLTLDNVAAPAGATTATPTTKDLSHVNVGVKLAGNRPSLKVGDAVSLMKVYEGNTIDAGHAVAITSDTPLVNKTTGMQGVSLRYNFDLLTREAEAGSGKNNELYATVTSASVNPDTKSLAETRAASLAFLTSGSDLLTDAAMTAAMEVAATPASESQAGRARVDGAPKEYRMWAVQNVSSMRLNSGSHVDAKGWGLNLGFAKQRVAGRNTLTYGPFVEYGKGSYDSYLDDGLHGSGNMDYLGVGVMAKSQSENGAYVEGSVRVGRVKSDYAGTIDNTHTTYDSSSTYYAGHLGVGQEKQLKNGNTIETYAKYFFTHQGGDTAKLSTGEVYDFDAADSHRIRFGTRYTSKKGDASFYTGLAYEYEFGNDIAASFEGYNTPSPSLTGGTGILELGYRFTPQNGRATYGIQLMGMTGKRRGISGGVQMHWAF